MRKGPGKRAAPLRHVGRRLVDLAHDAGRPFEERRAVLGERQLARRAMEERRAQAPLELGQPLADHRLRQAQAPRRLADRAGLRDGHEGGDAVQLQHRSGIPKTSSVIRSLKSNDRSMPQYVDRRARPRPGPETEPWDACRQGSPHHRCQRRHRPRHGAAVRGGRRQARRRRPPRRRARPAGRGDRRPTAATAVALAGDVRSEDYAKALVALAVERFGRLDIAFNNAGTLGEGGPSTGVSEAGWSDTIAINLTGCLPGRQAPDRADAEARRRLGDLHVHLRRLQLRLSRASPPMRPASPA